MSYLSRRWDDRVFNSQRNEYRLNPKEISESKKENMNENERKMDEIYIKFNHNLGKYQ